MERAVDDDAHEPRFASPQRLRGQDMQRVGCPDAESQTPEGAMRGGVRVGTGDQQSGLGDAELGRHHMQDALLRIVEPEIPHPIGAGVAVEPLQHAADGRIAHAFEALVAVPGRHIVVGAGDHLLRPMDGAPHRFEIVEGVPGAFVQQQIVHVEQPLALHLRHFMALPNLVHHSPAAAQIPGHMLPPC